VLLALQVTEVWIKAKVGYRAYGWELRFGFRVSITASVGITDTVRGLGVTVMDGLRLRLARPDWLLLGSVTHF